MKEVRFKPIQFYENLVYLKPLPGETHEEWHYRKVAETTRLRKIKEKEDAEKPPEIPPPRHCYPYY